MYFVIGMRKIKTNEEFKNKIVGHNHRERTYKNTHLNINPDKTKHNIHLTPLEFRNEEEIRSYTKKHLKKGKRQLQKNKAFAFELVVDCSKVPGWTEDYYIDYLVKAEEWFRNRFAGQKVVSSVIHRDEGKPHLHLTFLYFNEELGQWNQKQMYKNGLTDLNKILAEFERDIGAKYGFKKGKTKNLDEIVKNVEVGKGKNKRWYAKADVDLQLKKHKNLLKQVKDLKFYKDKADLERLANTVANHQLQEQTTKNLILEGENKQLQTTNKQLLATNKSLQKQVEEQEQKIQEQGKKIAELTNNVNAKAEQLAKQKLEPLQKKLAKQEQKLQEQEQVIEEQEQTILSYKSKIKTLKEELETYKKEVYKNIVEPLKSHLKEISFSSIKNKIVELYNYKKDRENEFDEPDLGR